MKINNKVESIKKIKELNLNQFPEKLIKSQGKEKENEVLQFIKDYPVEWYTLRDKSKQGGKAFHAVRPDEILDAIKVYDGPFSILVSFYNYKDNQIMVGEIQISGENVHFILSYNGEYSIRDMYKNPDVVINTSIFDDKTLNNISHFDDIYKFIMDKNLQNVIVEFGMFDKGVGKNNEKFIIYEIRTNY